MTSFWMICFIPCSGRNGHSTLSVDARIGFNRDMGIETVGWDLGFIRHQLDDLAELRVEGDWCRTDELHYQALCREERILL